jgi:hypothetical protein
MGRARVSGWIAKSTRQALYHRDADRCVYCGASEADGATLSLDHRVAWALGGTNEATNLLTACVSCNSAKQHRTIRGWLAYLRAMGTDTTGLADRCRRQAAKQLDRAEGRRRVAAKKSARAALAVAAAMVVQTPAGAEGGQGGEQPGQGGGGRGARAARRAPAWARQGATGRRLRGAARRAA